MSQNIKMLCLLLSYTAILFSHNVLAQYTIQDSLRGQLSTARSCFDVNYYHLNIEVFPQKQNISGYNDIYITCLQTFDSIQLDLFSNLSLDSIKFKNNHLTWRRQGQAFFVYVHANSNEKLQLRIYYHGKPQRAINPPWNGGFVWEKDYNKKDWIGVACQGTGASCWWPCKDHQSDEPDSMCITITYPATLVGVCNGRLEKETINNTTKTSTWRITYPINNYNVTLNIADYVHFSDTCISGGQKLSLDYYVLRYNEAKARQHFKQVPVILACYEQAFGPYPFIRDGYKLVETSYWGMEHQSCISYGNAYLNSAWDVDFIILHETAHEWWGNLLTAADNADMWLHEGFGTYAEALYVECRKDYRAGGKYMWDMRWRISNKYPIVGPYDVNYQGINNDNDMYYKGAWIIHTFRSVIHNDSIFFAWLRALQSDYAKKPASTESFIAFTNKFFGADYSIFFKQYLFEKNIPTLVYQLEKNKITAVFTNVIAGFQMPAEFIINQEQVRVTVSDKPTLIYTGNYNKKSVVSATPLFLFNVSSAKR